MATHAGSLFQDQKLNVHFNGAPIPGSTNVANSKKKKGGVGGRKPLNDISNSANISLLHTSKKHNPTNVISVCEDTSVPKSTTKVGGKANVTKASERGQSGGRKVLGDLTNSGKPQAHKALKKSLNQLSAVTEEEVFHKSIAEEQFLHNHQECIKAQKNTMDMDCFLKIIGLDKGYQIASASLPLEVKSENPYLELEEMSELPIEGQSPWYRKPELPREHETYCGSPKSPRMLMDYKFIDFVLTRSPEL